VEIAFERGDSGAINGVAMPVIELVASLGTIASAHGVDGSMLSSTGSAARGFASWERRRRRLASSAAHKELEQSPLRGKLERFSRTVSAEYADIIYGGSGFLRCATR